MIYGSLTYAGALLEQLARTATRALPATLQWVSFHLDADLPIEAVDPAEIAGWDLRDSAVARRHGDAWYDGGQSVALVVPSVVGRPVERNVLLNPRHPAFARIAVSEPEAVIWDERLVH